MPIGLKNVAMAEPPSAYSWFSAPHWPVRVETPPSSCTRRMQLFSVSATNKDAVSRLYTIPKGPLKRATVPVPSAFPAASPARVVTLAAAEISRILFASVTYKADADAALYVMEVGDRNDAAVPTPSAYTEEPTFPANTVTFELASPTTFFITNVLEFAVKTALPHPTTTPDVPSTIEDVFDVIVETDLVEFTMRIPL